MTSRPVESKGGRCLVVGVGNPMRGDDGAGHAVVDELRRLAPAGVDLTTASGDAAELIESWSSAEHVIVVDASASGQPAGTVSHFDAVHEPVPARMRGSSSHGLGVGEAVELARAVGRLPARLEVYALEGRDFSSGAALSAEVLRAARALARGLAGSLSPTALDG